MPVYKANAVKPRIVRLQPVISRSPQANPATQATFDGLNLQNIIAERYDNIQKSLAYCTVIKEHVRLADVELKEFDETVPVYLAQYGAYFAVTEIKADSDGGADVTLFRIDTNQDTQPTPVLPYDAEVEYIDTSGGAYIDTGIFQSNTHGFSIDVEYLVEKLYPFFGCMQNLTNGFSITQVNGATNAARLLWGTQPIQVPGTGGVGAHNVFDVNLYNSRKILLNNVFKKDLPETMAWTPTAAIQIGRARETTPDNIRVRAVKITNNDRLLFDAIPVCKNGKGCLYDRISGKVFENAGSGEITYKNL